MSRAASRRAARVAGLAGVVIACLSPLTAGAGGAPAAAARPAMAGSPRAIAAGAVAPLALGISDGAFLAADGATWLQRAAAAGSQWVRIDIGWVAPHTATEPAGFDPRNPADPHYSFTAADAAIRNAAANGLKVLLTFTGAPPWAEGPGRPASVRDGAWRPDPQALADYGIALARRYSGAFADPLHPGVALPRVAAFQPWNEPNLAQYLSPQWLGRQPASPAIYRAMLNAFYAAVKSVDPGALVVTAGTAPFGDPFTGGTRMPPALFVRNLLCLRKVGRGLGTTSCPDPARFDVLAHHPYTLYGPTVPALDPDDVSVEDIGKLRRLLRFAERTGRALPHVRHSVWVTEVGYNTKPPNPTGVPLGRDALWLDEAFEILWRAGVRTIFLNTIVDQPPNPTYMDSAQDGLYFANGQAKPAPLRAFEFPFLALRTHGSGLEAWGRAPAGGRLAIQERAGSSWRTLVTIAIGAHAPFLRHLDHAGPVTLRALVNGVASLPSSVA